MWRRKLRSPEALTKRRDLKGALSTNFWQFLRDPGMLKETSETLVELRAQLFGALLGRVPDAALRLQFEKHLKEWSRRKAHQHWAPPKTAALTVTRSKGH
eukprot:Skav233066  [mRNA]  locus=scaffold1468:77878:82468:- [translate_table: standard]